jgi:LmbE family N-acetylglucosaminyl deacetylase
MRLAELLHPAAEFAWRCTFYAAGRTTRPRAACHSPSCGKDVLVVAPHPDDEAVGCAGTILLHRRSGDRVCLAYITDGARSRAGGLDARHMRELRMREAQAASAMLGATRVEWLGLPEGSWTIGELVSPLSALLRETAPGVIYAPSRVDFHPEHRAVACAVARALSTQAALPPGLIVRVYQLQVPLTPVLTNLVVDCSEVRAATAGVIGVYASQAENLGRACRQRGYTARFYGLASQGEEFWQMPAAQYCKLHAGDPEVSQAACFRGIRYRPFSDPLAYAAGFRERRRLGRSRYEP